MAEEEKEQSQNDGFYEREDTTVGSTREKAPSTFEDGFSWYSVIGAFFVGFVMMPASIYLQLLMGQGIGAAAQWVTVILFMEIIRRSGGSMRKQEMRVLLYIAGGLVGGGPFAPLIVKQFLFQSPVAESFRIIENLKAEGVRWVAPFPGSEAYAKRTFLHADWVKPLLLIIVWGFLSKVHNFTGGYFIFRLTSDLERLPFPLAAVSAEGATALADASSGNRKTWRWNLFSVGAMIGLAFGSLYVFIPTFTGSLFNAPIALLPIPFIDFSASIGHILPASLWGVSTDLGVFLSGFIIPMPIIVGQFVGSLITQILINPTLQRMGQLPNWREGMDSIQTAASTNVNFWISATIGASVVVAVLGLYESIKAWRGRKDKKGKVVRSPLKPVPGRGDFPMWLAGVLWMGSMAAFVYISHMLVPSFPFVFLIFFGFIWSPFDTYVSARMRGMTSTQDWQIPYMKEGMFMLSKKMGYSGMAIWFAPMPLTDQGASSQFFREVELTGTKFTSIIKAELLMWPIILVTSFLFWSLLWKLGPIPSAIYPYAQKFWPLNAMMQCIWYTGTLDTGKNFLLEAVKLRNILLGGVIGSGALIFVQVFRLPMLLFYGLLNGLVFGLWPHYSILIFSGGLLSKYVFQKKYGPRKWKSYAAVLISGFYCGMGLIGMAGIAVAFIAKSVYQMPF